MSLREKLILCGLFLSKFDQEGLRFLGFESFTEAFNTLGYGLNSQPATIKNYRDEIDPYFPNDRKGWHQRSLRKHCKEAIDKYGSMSLFEMGGKIREFLNPEVVLDSIPGVKNILIARDVESDTSFSKRLITGQAAENYFSIHFTEIPVFHECEITNVTHLGCGFDFKVKNRNRDELYAVEVKGIRTPNGSILLTELEWKMAGALKDNYFLCIVRNFLGNPFHTVIQDPLNSYLNIQSFERRVTERTWKARVQ